MRRLIPSVCGAVVLAAAALAAATGYHILSDIQIGGEGGWDYLTVDSAARRLYVSHATHVVVVDLDTNKVVGDIPDTPGVHGIAIAPELNKGFVSNGRGNNVTIFDLKTLKATGTAATGENPDSIRYDAVSSARVRVQRPLEKRHRDRCEDRHGRRNDSAARQARILGRGRQRPRVREPRGHQRDRGYRRGERNGGEEVFAQPMRRAVRPGDRHEDPPAVFGLLAIA